MGHQPHAWAVLVSAIRERTTGDDEQLAIFRSLERVEGFPPDIPFYLKVRQAIALAVRHSGEDRTYRDLEAAISREGTPHRAYAPGEGGDGRGTLRKKRADRFRYLVFRAFWQIGEEPLAELFVADPESFDSRYARGGILCGEIPGEDGPGEGEPASREVRQQGAGAPEWRVVTPEAILAEALYTIGRMYERGEGGPRREKEALYWYRLASRKGHPKAFESEIRLDVKDLFPRADAG